MDIPCSQPNEEVLTKRKSIQKKRRITKIKKETRRRKKRMRFYPQPLWLRYRFYSQFLKDRRSNTEDYVGRKIRYSFHGPHASRAARWFPYSTGIPNMDLSRSIMGEFKTAFWKSYWLRSNLKPYLNVPAQTPPGNR
jgi:hypothetical protein